MRHLQTGLLGALILSLIGNTTQAANLFLRSGTTTCIFNGTSSQTLQTAAGTATAGAAFTTQTSSHTFYSAALASPAVISSSRTAGGVIGVQNNGNADFTVTARQTLYDYDPVTGVQVQILAGTTSAGVVVARNGKIGLVTLPSNTVGGAGYTIPTGHMLKAVVTLTVNLSTGINGTLIFNASSKKSNAKSYIAFPERGNPWSFRSFQGTPPDATIVAPSSVAMNSTGNVASVRDAGVGATYLWTLTNGTITAGQSTRQITWTAGASGTVGVGVTIVSGCASSGSASVISLTVKTNQTITFDPIAAHTYGDAPFTLNATASSGLPVTFTVVSGPATVSGNTMTLTGAGTVIVDAVQNGNADYNPAISEQFFVVNPKTLTVSGVTVSSKVYDGNTDATVNTAGAALVGVLAGDDVTLDTTAVAGDFADKNVGAAKPVTVSGLDIDGTDILNYVVVQPAASADITPAGLTVSGVTAVDKVYDGTTAASLNLGSAALAGVVAGDSVSLDTAGVTAAFADKLAGTGKSVLVGGFALAGADAANYTLTQPGPTANITARALVIGATAADKVYDGTTAAAVSLSDNRVAGDSLAVTYTSANFADKNVGSGKTVTVSGVGVTGADAVNYTFSTTTTTAAAITARVLNVSATAASKTYDGSVAAGVTLSDDRVGGDGLVITFASASFADENAGTGKTVTVSGISVAGTDAGNYTLASAIATTTANITARALVVSATAADKVYDGTDAATVTLSDNRLAGDALTVSYVSAVFSSPNVSVGDLVTVSGISLSGPDAGNYTCNTSATDIAVITPATVTATVTGVDKGYDGTTAATVNWGLTGVLAGDDVYLNSGLANYDNKNVGVGKTITVTGLGIAGGDAGNYVLASTTATGLGNITPRALWVNVTPFDKVYDGTTTATIALTDDRIPGDDLTATYGTATFASRNVGVQTITVLGISISGPDAGNYTHNTTGDTAATITPASLTVSATAEDKVYDGTTAANVTSITLNGVIAGDDVFASSAIGVFANKNAGTGKTVTVSSISVGGADMGNYTLASATATTMATITARTLVVSATAADKVYDGTTAASVTLSDNRVSGDSLTASYTSANFANADAGTGKIVTVSGISISGTDAGNYAANTTATTTASITAAPVTPGIVANNKVYDGTTTATLASRTLGGLIPGDSVTLNCGSANFSDAAVGPNKVVTATGLVLAGAKAGNYVLANSSATSTASIFAPAVAPVITGCTLLADGSIKVDCSGAAGQSYSIVATSDLASGTWQTVMTGVLDLNGLGSFTDTDASQHPARFYRTMVSN